MKYVVCCVRDIVGNQYGSPHFAVSVGMAIRTFSDEVNRAAEDNLLYKHPADFELFELGSFDNETAKFTLLDVPNQLIAGKQAVVGTNS